jgi:putative transcriptional regulator
MKKIQKKTSRKSKLSLRNVMQKMAKDLYTAKVIDAETMHQFDEKSISPIIDLDPSEIKSIRIREKVSQPVFAKCLNITTSTVKQWEQGEKHPRGTSLKLLNIIAKKGLQAVR